MAVPSLDKNAPGGELWVDAEIYREHDLIAQRMNWYVTSQSFLLTGFAVMSSKDNSLAPIGHWLFPALGMLVSITIWLGILAAALSLARLRRRQKQTCSTDFRQFWYDGRPWFHSFGLIPVLVIPVLFFIAWIILWVKF